MTQRNVRERWSAAAAILFACLAGAQVFAQQAVDLNNDGVNDTVRREVRLHQTDPVISRIVLVSGVDDTGFLSIATKTPNDMFGWYVSPIGDFDADGFEDLAVTAPASLIAEGLGPNDPGGPIPAWRGRVQLVSGASGAELMTIFNPEATLDSIFGLGAAPIPDQDADGMPDLLVGGMRIVPAPTTVNPNATNVELRWWVMSVATGEPIRMGVGQVGAVGCEFLLPNETPDEFWASNECAGDQVYLPGIAGDLDGDGDVDSGDAAALIGEWTNGAPGVARVGDLNGDGVVSGADLSILLSQVGFPPDLVVALGTDGEDVIEALRNWNPLNEPVCPGGTHNCRMLGGMWGVGDMDGDGDGDGNGDGDGDWHGDGPCPGCTPTNPCTGPCCGSNNPCCGNNNPCCGSTNPCCGNNNPCCGSTNPCCGNTDPCCGSTAPCCLNPCADGCNPCDSDCAAIDIRMDMNGDGGIDGADNGLENEQPWSNIGKVIVANDNDDDHDGIPDYADGFSIHGGASSGRGDEQTDSERFARLLVRVKGDVDPDERRFYFNYDDSDPTALTYQESPEGDVYTLPFGTFRIWKKPGEAPRDPRDVSLGGDFVSAGTAYSARELGIEGGCGSVSLWVEAVQWGASGTISCSMNGVGADSLKISPLGIGYAPVLPSGNIGWMSQTVEPSEPSPRITTSEFSLTNLRINPVGPGLLADVVVAGSLDDAASDLIEGPRGVIDSVSLRVNGARPIINGVQTDAVVGVSVSKESRDDSILKSDDYSGSFYATIAGVEVQPGANLVQLLATNTFGYTGYAERSFEVVTQAPPDEVYGVELDFNGQAIVGPVGQVIEALVSGSFGLPRPPGGEPPRSVIPVTLTHAGLGVYSGAGDFGPVTLVLDAAASEIGVEGADILVFSVTMQAQGIEDFAVALVETPPLSPMDFVGEFTITEADRPTWDGYGLSLGAVSGVAASSGGSFHPHLIEVIGPPGLAELWRTAQLTPDGDAYTIVRHAQSGRFFLAHEGDTAPRAFMVVDIRALNQTPDEEYGERRDGAFNFAAGFGAGLYGSGAGMVDGVVQIGRGAWHLAYHYNAISMTVRLWQEGEILLVEDERKINALSGLVQTVLPVVEELIVGGPDIAYAILSGDPGAVGNLSEENRLVAEFIVEATESVLDELALMEDYDAGYVCGIIAGEVATDVVLAAASGGIAVAAKSATMARVLSRLDSIPGIPPGVISRLEDVAQTVPGLATTRMCFIAGTLVATPGGAIAIEDARPGDAVWSADEHPGPAGARAPARVIRSIVTHPERLHELTYRVPDDRYETIIGTAEHPFFVANAAAADGSCGAWVPMHRLREGDELVLLSGSAASVVDMEVRRGLSEQRTEGAARRGDLGWNSSTRSFTTYNLEIGGFHTYFAGPEGAEAWVHNEGRAPCERVFSIFDRIRRRDSLQGDPIEAWKRTLTKFDTINGRKLDADTLRTATIAVMKDVYENPPRLPSGQIDFDKISYTKMSQAWAGNLDGPDLETHHTAVSRLAKIMYRKTHNDADPPAGWADRMPGFVMPRTAHNFGASDIPGVATFHDALKRRVPGNGILENLTANDIRTAVSRAYDDFASLNPVTDEFDFRRVRDVMDQWLAQEVFGP